MHRNLSMFVAFSAINTCVRFHFATVSQGTFVTSTRILPGVAYGTISGLLPRRKPMAPTGRVSMLNHSMSPIEFGVSRISRPCTMRR